MKQTPFDIAELKRREREYRRERTREFDEFCRELDDSEYYCRKLHDKIVARHGTGYTEAITELRQFMRHNATGIDRHTRLIHKLQIWFDQECPDLSLTPTSGLIAKTEAAPDNSHNWHGRDDMFEVRAQRTGSIEARQLEQLMKQRKHG